jgi:hypothetical protein
MYTYVSTCKNDKILKKCSCNFVAQAVWKLSPHTNLISSLLKQINVLKCLSNFLRGKSNYNQVKLIPIGLILFMTKWNVLATEILSSEYRGDVNTLLVFANRFILNSTTNKLMTQAQTLLVWLFPMMVMSLPLVEVS